MRNLIRALVLLPAFSFNGCGGGDSSGGQPLAADLSHEFALGFGETINLGELSLEFMTLVDDSRCGIGGPGVCVWEGNGQILVNATKGRESQALILNTNPKFPTSAQFAGYVIELRRLDPQPTFSSNGRPDADEYTATFVVDKT
jgi:hypothetical protein